MPKFLLQKSKTSQTIYAFIQDSSVTTGAGKTGLAWNSAGLITGAYYVTPTGLPQSISLSALVTATSAWLSGGFIEVDNVNMKGLYRLDLPNAVFSSGGERVVVMLQNGTNMVPVAIEIQLTGPDFGSIQTIQKNQPYNNFEFLMTDNVNHAPATGKTVSVFRSIDGGGFAAGTLSAVTEVGNGIYAVNFGAGDTNGGTITLRATASGCDDTLVTLLTVT